jgi:hypothetical protein
MRIARKLLLSLSWTIINRAEAMVFRVPLPGGRSISFNQETGVLRIKLSPETNTNIQVPPLGTAPSKTVMESIFMKDTGTAKGFGAFAQSDIPAEKFLGLYEGDVITTREELDRRISIRKRYGKENGWESVQNVMDYVLSLDGGVTFVDGFDRAQDRSSFSPVHLNHADKGTQECNVGRLLEDDRVAFFTSRDIVGGEELCFDYGSNFWAGRKATKI